MYTGVRGLDAESGQMATVRSKMGWSVDDELQPDQLRPGRNLLIYPLTQAEKAQAAAAAKKALAAAAPDESGDDDDDDEPWTLSCSREAVPDFSSFGMGRSGGARCCEHLS